jgi:DNA polymerase
MDKNDLDKSHHGLQVLQEEYKECTKCSLHLTRNKVVFGIGTVGSILIVAEAPGEVEDHTGYPLVGQSGQILDYLLCRTSDNPKLIELAKSFPAKKLSMYNWGWPDFEEAKRHLLEEIFYTNAVLCRPPDNRTPLNPEIKACNSRLKETIYQVDPKIIISVGKTALEAILNKKISSINKACGKLVDFTLKGRCVDVSYSVMPILHPSFLARNPDMHNPNGYWNSTIEQLTTIRKIINGYKT